MKNILELLAFPNPELGSLCNHQAEAKHVEEPYSKAISAGKNTYVYDAHTYHTKVPPQGIALLIDYYTHLGDVVLDPFCGSGMTGVAATTLGRSALLCDLSPAAVFIAANMNTPIDARRYESAVCRLLDTAADLERDLYSTTCRECNAPTPILYTVWSFGMLCPHCEHEFVLWNVARDERPRVRDSKILSEFPCPHCARLLKKRGLKRTRRYPVALGYKCCTRGLKESTSPLNGADHERLERIAREWTRAALWHPVAPLPEGVNTKQPIAAGIDTVDKCYTPRALWAMAHLWEQACRWPDEDVRAKLLWTLTSLYQRVTVFSEFRFWGGSGNTANYNVPAIMNEQNVFRAFARKANTIRWYFESAPRERGEVRLSTQSACHLPQVADKSVDYIFTDPPFGSNINYSEMNFLWESWLCARTDTTEEAIVHPHQNKGLREYQELLRRAFSEAHRVLKDNAWMTVVFHNSSEHVWRALQNAIEEAGFRVDGTQTFDKEHGTFKQFVSQHAVGYDLVLHCRKSWDAPTHPHQHNSSAQSTDVAGDLADFIRHMVEGAPHRFVTHYRHVARADEFDYRRLYADWLAHSLATERVAFGFEEFRRRAIRILAAPSSTIGFPTDKPEAPEPLAPDQLTLDL